MDTGIIRVGGLPPQVKEEDVEKLFRRVGRLTDISMKNGCAFVKFDDIRDVDEAIYDLDGKKILGNRITVERVKPDSRVSDNIKSSDRPSRYHRSSTSRKRSKERHRYEPSNRTEYRLIVENLSSRIDHQDLKSYMRKAGKITHTDAHTKRRHEGFVEFASYSDMKTAIRLLDNTKLNGRRIRLVEDKHRRRSRPPTSRSRSSSRDRLESTSRSSRIVPTNRSTSPVRSRSRSIIHDRSKSRAPVRPKIKRPRSPSNSNTDHKRIRVDEFASCSDKKNTLKCFNKTEVNERHINLVENNPRMSCSRSCSFSRNPRKSMSRNEQSVLTRKFISSASSRSKSPAHSRSKSLASSRSKSVTTGCSESRSNSITSNQNISVEPKCGDYLDVKVKSLLEKMKILEEKVTSLEKGNQDLKKENQDLKKENQDLKKENQDLKKENQDLNKRIIALENQNQELLTNQRKLESTLKHMDQSLRDMSNVVQPLQRFANYIFSREIIRKKMRKIHKKMNIDGIRQYDEELANRMEPYMKKCHSLAHATSEELFQVD